MICSPCATAGPILPLQDAASLQNGIGSYASSADHDHQRRVAALMEEQQFQNLRVRPNDERACPEAALQQGIAWPRAIHSQLR